VKKARHPFEIAIDVQFLRNFIDVVNRGNAGFPKSFGGIIAENLDQVVHTLVGDICQVGGRMTGIGTGTTSAFQENDFDSGFFEQIARGDAGEAASNNNDLCMKVSVNRGELGPVAAGFPVRSRIHNSFVPLLSPGFPDDLTSTPTFPASLAVQVGNHPLFAPRSASLNSGRTREV
jgi:hypothetical protein